MDLPPGFRFHPTDEELISQYLYKKVTDTKFTARAIGEVDMNRCEPWDLPWKAKMGEKEWYFFCVKDRKYPTGLRTNRATEAGYWKATGKDKEIFKGKSLVGLKKTLVFYKGRAPKGEKSNWVMHEYRFHGKFTLNYLQETAKNEWVICRVFQKSLAAKKIHISGIMKLDSYGNEFGSYVLPSKPINDSSYVPCFSNPIDNVETNPFYTTTQGFHQVQAPVQENSSLLGSVYTMQDHTMMRNLYDNGSNIVNVGFKNDGEIVSVSQETCLTTDMNAETMDLDGLWNY